MLDVLPGKTTSFPKMRMNRSVAKEIEEAGADPLHPTWIWFTEDGPHGVGLTWSRTRTEPPGYVGIEHLTEHVSELSEADRAFSESLKEVVATALRTRHPELLQRAIQIAAATGQVSELDTIVALTNHPHELVAKTARAGAFHLKKCTRQRGK